MKACSSLWLAFIIRIKVFQFYTEVHLTSEDRRIVQSMRQYNVKYEEGIITLPSALAKSAPYLPLPIPLLRSPQKVRIYAQEQVRHYNAVSATDIKSTNYLKVLDLE